MYKLEYAPRATDDMARVKEYITLQHGATVARKSLRKLTSSARRLEKFPEEGPSLEGMIMVPTDYRYLYIKPNYLFYRIEGNTVKVVRVLNEQQDFLRILFGI
ncbi:type II toxin-antitoxin system RelE/ParE family toxin [Lachnoclostridium pacaense]|uniref:type II toxin-antitoxin system RelE/ParE family toxin n=1 Tax=Enterocloster hominis (ex Hitch et al. 2024) TaxID=1917870 RepID=UPI001D1281CB|nr:type II toxin-antitoxin system RelE/ParE family toxin [Lachnoclostridium pacaense]MCC2879126.1 type II toxin-antitoxin system RelE/ParE family toxin [Lachnoclostridium pacaense]